MVGDVVGLFFQPKPSQLRKVNIASEEESRKQNQAMRTGIRDTLCPLALRSPSIATATGIPHTPPTLKRRAPPRPRNHASNGARYLEDGKMMRARGGPHGSAHISLPRISPCSQPYATDAGEPQHRAFVAP